MGCSNKRMVITQNQEFTAFFIFRLDNMYI